MAKSLAQLKFQIEKLQKEAAVVQNRIVTRIKKEIAEHGLTVEHLFGSTTPSASETAKPAKVTKPKTSKTSRSPKFADGAGNVWGGMGKRPDWIRAALASGKSLEGFLVKKNKTAMAKKKAKVANPTATKPAAKVAAPAKKATKAKKPAAVPASKPKAVVAKKVVGT